LGTLILTQSEITVIEWLEQGIVAVNWFSRWRKESEGQGNGGGAMKGKGEGEE